MPSKNQVVELVPPKKHRALSYMEKKMNKMSRVELLEHLFHKGDPTPESVQHIFKDKEGIDIKITQARRVAKELGKKIFNEEVKTNKVYTDFVNEIFETRNNIADEFHPSFTLLDSLGFRFFVVKEAKKDSDMSNDDLLMEGIYKWYMGGSEWEVLINSYYNAGDIPL